MSTSSYIYAVQVGSDGPVKIGTSKTPGSRLQDLQGANPYPLSLLKVAKGGVTLERTLHRALQQYHLRGEWFEHDEHVLAAIASLPDAEGLILPGFERVDPASGSALPEDVLEKAGEAFAGFEPNVYVVQAEIPGDPDGGPVRIGFSWTVGQSLAALREACPFPLKVRNIVAAGPHVADELHERLAGAALHGSWFRAGFDVETEIFDLPYTAQELDSPGTSFGRTPPALPRDHDEQVNDVKALSAGLDMAFRREYAPYSLVIHRTRRPIKPLPMMTAVEVLERMRRAQSQDQRKELKGFCIFSRPLDSSHPEFLEWRRIKSIGTCPGGCHGHSS